MTSRYKTLFIVALIALSFKAFPLLSQDTAMEWRVGEALTYTVRWSFVRLGTLKIKIAASSFIDDEQVFHAQLHIDSNPLLFFVNRHYIYYADFSESFKVQKLVYFDDEEGVHFKSEYMFDHSKKTVHITRTDTNGVADTIEKDLAFEGDLYDGFSLIYYARNTIHTVRVDTVQYIADDGYAPMIIDFKGKDKPVKVVAFKEKIPSSYIEGYVFDKGVAGLSGKFQGWFSSDKRRLPLKARLKVFIGSVIVELEDVR